MLRTVLLALTLSVCGPSLAQGGLKLEVKDAWARPTVAGQSGGGAFMTLVASENAKLIGATSPVAGVTEIHEMVMDGHVMKMRAMASLDLPAGQPVALKSGAHHLMLMDLKQPFKVGEAITVELRVQDAAGKTTVVPVQVQVRARAPQTEHNHGAHHH